MEASPDPTLGMGLRSNELATEEAMPSLADETPTASDCPRVEEYKAMLRLGHTCDFLMSNNKKFARGQCVGGAAVGGVHSQRRLRAARILDLLSCRPLCRPWHRSLAQT